MATLTQPFKTQPKRRNQDDERWEKLLAETPMSALDAWVSEVEAEIERGETYEICTFA